MAPVFRARSFTGPGEAAGEVVFNTAMTGYQEILTDPSYKGQLVTMTYPLIGNYGVNDEDVESDRVQVEAFLVKEYLPFPSNFRSQSTLAEYLKRSEVLGLEGIDTRALTRHIRNFGAMRAVASTRSLDPAELIGAGPGPSGHGRIESGGPGDLHPAVSLARGTDASAFLRGDQEALAGCGFRL